MPTHRPKIEAAAQPSNRFFDPYNSSASGHQRFENRLSGSTIYAASREAKLRNQLNGRPGGEDLFIVENDPGDGGTARWAGITEVFEGGQITKADPPIPPSNITPFSRPPPKKPSTVSIPTPSHSPPPDLNEPAAPTIPLTTTPPPLFADLTFYINGSTHPLISDHALKQLLALHGGRVLLAPARRRLTHVVLGKVRERGLAAGKAQRELMLDLRRRGAVRVVGVEWVLDSVRGGRRRDESLYRVGGVGELGGGMGYEGAEPRGSVREALEEGRRRNLGALGNVPESILSGAPLEGEEVEVEVEAEAQREAGTKVKVWKRTGRWARLPAVGSVGDDSDAKH